MNELMYFLQNNKELEKNGACTFHNDILKTFFMVDLSAETAYMASKVKDVKIIEHIDYLLMIGLIINLIKLYLI